MGFDRYIDKCENIAYQITQEEQTFIDLFGKEEFQNMRNESFARNLTLLDYLDFIKETKIMKLEEY